MAAPMEIKLAYPITVDGKKVDRLAMRRPKVRDQLLAAEATGGQQGAKFEVQLFANLCEVPADALQDLDMADYLALQQAYQSFLSSSPARPATP